MITYAIAPSPKWYFLDAQGRPAAGGTLTTWQSSDHSTPKFVFSDPGGLFPYTDPIILDSTGGTPVPMYWDVTTPGLYYIVVKDASGNIIFDLDHFPISGSGGVTPITTSVDIENHVVNGAFLFIDATDDTSSIISPAPAGNTRVAPASGFFKTFSGDYISDYLGNLSGWIFEKQGGAGETSSIRFVDITTLGVAPPTNPSANATRFFRYTLTSPASPQTAVRLYQTVPGVESFQNELLTISFDIQASSAGVGSFEFYQFFGTGGTPSAAASIIHTFNFVISPSGWSRVAFTITPPSTVGKTKGTNANDSIQLRWNFPINVTGSFDITNLQVQRGNFATPAYIYQDYNQDQYKVLIDLMTHGNAIFPTGELKFLSSEAIAPIGWLLINNSASDTLGSAASGANFAGIAYRNLYVAWWGSFPDSECTVTTGRGANALADFNANKKMTAPKSLVGSSIAPYGSGVLSNTLFGQFSNVGGGIGAGGGTFYLALYVKL